MTCIVGYVDKGEVYIGGDSMAVIDSNYFIDPHKKVFEIGPFLIGGAGDSDALDRIEHFMSIDPRPDGITDVHYLNTCFIPALKYVIKDFSKPEVNLIVGYNKAIYFVAGDFTIGSTTEKFMGAGSGGAYAVGAMAILDKMNNLTPKQKLIKAMQASERFINSVKGPYYVIKQKGNL